MIARTSATLLCLIALLSAATVSRAADAPAPDGEGFVPMFNGKDLTGWKFVNTGPKTFYVTPEDGIVHTTGVPTGFLSTERQYENFIIEIDWMHEKAAGNSGLFLYGGPMTAPGTPFAKGIEVQILDDAYVQGEARAKHLYTGHGDIFSIHGASMVPDRPHPQGWARCLPSEDRCNPAGQWNHYRVESNDGKVTLAVNGKVVSGGTKLNPRKGYLCLEAEGSPAQFKNIRIKELPSTNPGPDVTQPEALPFKTLYTGYDLTGWKQDPANGKHWIADGWNLVYDGKIDPKAGGNFWTEGEYGDFEMIVDWRFTAKVPDAKSAEAKNPSELQTFFESWKSGILFRGQDGATMNISCAAGGSGGIVRGEQTAAPSKAADHKPGGFNRSIITVRGDHVTVKLNGETVVDNAQITGLPKSGPIGLKNDGAAITFASLFVRELKD